MGLPRWRSRGATMVEYAILLVGVLLIGAGAIKVLGGKVKAKVEHAGDVATNSGGGGGGGGGGGAAAGAGGGGGGGGGGGSGVGGGTVATKGGVTEGKATVGSKASVGGVGDTKNGAGSSGGPPPSSGGDGAQPNGNSPAVEDSDLGDSGSFGVRKGLALAMLAIGLVSVAYFFMKTKKVVKDIKEAK